MQKEKKNENPAMKNYKLISFRNWKLENCGKLIKICNTQSDIEVYGIAICWDPKQGIGDKVQWVRAFPKHILWIIFHQ